MFRPFAPFALLPLLLSSGCELAARNFAGTVIEMTLTGASPNSAGEHYELWTRSQYNDVIRISGIYPFVPPGQQQATLYYPYGFAVRPAITMDDPCMIDSQGNLLVTAQAYTDTTILGTALSPEDQAQAVRGRIGALTATSNCDGSGGNPLYHCGREVQTMLGAVAYELADANGAVTNVAPPTPTTCETSNNAPGCISFNAAPADRLATCQAYWNASPLSYTPNPLQITAPAHGLLYGVLTYTTTTPVQAFDGFRIDSNIGNLAGAQELWITTEPDQVNGNMRGPVFIQGVLDHGGNEVLHFDLSPPLGSTLAVSGTAVLEVDLNNDAVIF
jgi:hypothetical protein